MASEHTAHHSFIVGDRSHLALIKKEIHLLAAKAGFNATQLGKIDIVAAEIGSNFIKHTGGGEFLVRAVAGAYIDIIGLDNGAGMADSARMMEDGVSTSNTLGGGLGAIRRLSDEFDIYSQKAWGTIIFSRFYVPAEKPVSHLPYQLYSLLVPYPGQQVCGDGFYEKADRTQACLFLGDGLGHGPEAHNAVQAALQVLKTAPAKDPAELLRSMHDGVKKTRGLVGTIALYAAARRSWQICGIGNISTRILHGLASKNCMAYNGIIGHNIPRTLNNQVQEVARGSYLVLASDGLRTRWELTKYPGIHRCGPCMLAAALYKDLARRTDDASVVVVRML